MTQVLWYEVLNYLDAYLTVVLERNLHHPEVLDLGKRGLGFNQKLRLARAVTLIDQGLSEDLLRAISAMK